MTSKFQSVLKQRRKSSGLLSLSQETILNCLHELGVDYKFDASKRNIQICSPTDTSDRKFKCYIYIGEPAPKKNPGSWRDFKATENSGSQDFIHLYQVLINEKDYGQAKCKFMLSYIKDLGKILKQPQRAQQKDENVEFVLPLHFRRLLDTDVEYIEYLKQRKIDYSNLKLFVDEKSRRIVFPLYVDGELISYSGRAIDPDVEIRWIHASKEEVDKGVLLFGLDNCSLRAYIFEGITDALSFRKQSIAIMGATISEEQAQKIRNHGITEVYYVGDQDAPGLKNRKKNLETLNEYFQEIYYFDWKSSGYKEKDFSEIKKVHGDIKTDGHFKLYRKNEFELMEILNGKK